MEQFGLVDRLADTTCIPLSPKTQAQQKQNIQNWHYFQLINLTHNKAAFIVVAANSAHN